MEKIKRVLQQTIGAKELILFIEKKISYEDLVSQWISSELKYTKKQMTWFSKQENINWFNIENREYEKSIVNFAKTWHNTN